MEGKEREGRSGKRRGPDIHRGRIESALGRYMLAVGMTDQGAKVRHQTQAEEVETTDEPTTCDV